MKKFLLFLSITMLVNISLSAQDTLVTFKFKVDKDSSQTFGNSYNTDNIVLRDSTYHLVYAYVGGINGNPPVDYSLSSTVWTGGLDSLKNYYTSFSSSAYMNVLISSRQKSSGTGPRDFKLQYKVGAAGTWTNAPGGAVVCANDAFISGTLTNLELPSDCDNQLEVFLRWVMTSNTSVGGGTVASGGTSRIDNIFILATPIPVGINSENFNENISIYPNPSNGNFTIINATETHVAIEVFDLLGNSVLKSQSNEKNINLSLENKNAGLYFVQLTNKSGNKTVKKLVIK